MSNVLKDLRAFISYRVREGFESVHEMIENATEYVYETHGREDFGPKIRRITAELLAVHRAEQTGWEKTTDCDRIDKAFATLNRMGIVARHNFSCCNNCGFIEIWDEIEEEEKHHPVEGYVFYHLQAIEAVIESGQLLMAYGCVAEDEVTFVRVAEKIVAELRHVGLNTSWGGTVYHPIVIEGIVWHRCR
jgi:hypothetical protein